MEIGTDAVIIAVRRDQRDRLPQLALIDAPRLGALEDAAPPQIFAGATRAIGRALGVEEEVGAGRRCSAAQTGEKRREAGGGSKSANQHRLNPSNYTTNNIIT